MDSYVKGQYYRHIEYSIKTSQISFYNQEICIIFALVYTSYGNDWNSIAKKNLKNCTFY